LLVWVEAARSDLLNIQRYIAEDNPEAALRVAVRIGKKAKILADHPHIGRVGEVPGTREWVVSGLPYTLVYRVKERNLVEVLRVVHQSQAWPPMEDG
jgi:addiction module RelE/StbE family toxin